MAAKDRPPAFQFYARDYMADPGVQALTWEQRGRYTWALCCSWESGTYGVATEDQWRKWMRYGPAAWLRVRDLFRVLYTVDADEIWNQRRMRSVRDDQVARSQSAVIGGLVSACKRGEIDKQTLSERLADAGLSFERCTQLVESVCPTLPLPLQSASENQEPCVATQRADAPDRGADMRGMVLGLAASKKIERPRPKNWRVDPADAWAKAKALGPRAKIAMQLVGYLGKHGAGEFYATCALAHFVENHATIENPFAYYSPKSDNGKMLETDWSRRAEIDHARKEQALTEAWLRGRDAA